MLYFSKLRIIFVSLISLFFIIIAQPRQPPGKICLFVYVFGAAGPELIWGYRPGERMGWAVWGAGSEMHLDPNAFDPALTQL